MLTQGDLFNKITDWKNVYRSYQLTQRGKAGYKSSAIKFAQDHISNLKQLQHEIVSCEYQVSEYSSFKVFEPKERIVCAPAYRDKITQHMVYQVIRDIYEPCFIYDSYSCIRGKGNQRAVKRIQHFMRKAKWLYGKSATILKLDIKKFFYSIDRAILKSIVAKKITCRRSYDLVCKIIDSSPSEAGLPLGNLTSQLFANVYLNELDHYVKRSLKCKFYVRYADDTFFVLNNRSHAISILNKVREYLRQKLGLTTHAHKTVLCQVASGVTGLGFKIKLSHIGLRKDNKNRTKKRLKPGADLSSINDSMLSWLSFASMSEYMTFLHNLLLKYGKIKLESDCNYAIGYKFTTN